MNRRMHKPMITYGLIIVAAVYVTAKWIKHHAYKKKAMTREQIDAALIDRLNRTEGSHAD
ncbi:MAG: hypothetical protein K0Q59_6122 [Paenibacillus sp.]|nr:hypothetical protein [Paenibacillus sp.]